MDLNVETWVEGDTYEYLWSTGETTEGIEIETAGTYSVTLTNTATSCIESAEIEVTDTAAPAVSINASAVSICEGSTVQLDAIPNPSGGNFSYEWSTGETTSNIQVGSSGVYKLTLRDLETGCEATAEFDLPANDIEVTITSTREVLCPNASADLEVEDIYTFYDWSTGDSGSDLNMLSINAPGTYQITVTNNNGCTAEDEIVIGDTGDPDAIKSFFEERGFYAVPITIIGPAFNFAGNSMTSNLCEQNECLNSGDNFCMQDDASLSISVNGVQNGTINDFKQLIIENSIHFEDEFGYESPTSYITSNDDICNCDDYLEKADIAFNNTSLGYWIHLWSSANSTNSDEDLMFILANVPTEENLHYPGTERRSNLIDAVLEQVGPDPDIGSFASKGEQIIYTTQNLLLDNHLGLKAPYNGQDGINYPTCGNTEVFNGIGMAPTCIPFGLPSVATMQFEPFPNWENFYPLGTMTGFTDLSEYAGSGNINYFDGIIDMSVLPIGTPKFLGYYQVSIKGTPLYSLPDNSDPGEDPDVILGFPEIVGGATHIRTEVHNYTGPPPPSPPTAEGDITVSNSILDCGDPENYFELLPTPPQEPTPDPNITLPPIDNIDLSNTEYDVFGYQGILITVPNSSGSNDYIYARYFSNGLNYFRWNCYTARWESFDPDDMALVNMIESRLVAHENDLTEIDDIQSELDAPACFFLTEDQVLPFTVDHTLAGLPINSNAQLKDFGGLDQSTLDEITTSIDIANERWNLKIQYILSGDDPNGESTELEMDLAYNAKKSFDEADLSREEGYNDDPNNPNPNSRHDMAVWFHYRSDGKVGLCIKFAPDFFTFHTSTDEGDQFDPNNSDHVESLLKLKSTFTDGIRSVIGKDRAELEDNNPSNDVDIVDILPSPDNPSPWYIGLRPVGAFPEGVNFYTLMKEIAGIGSYCISEQAPPERLWKYDGVCMFDAPGGVIGVAQGVVENNPVVGLIQLTSFAFTVATDEETQDGLIEACKHPIKTAQGIYETKKDQYINNDDIEVTYYHAGLDGVTIIFAVLSGGASVLNYVKGLSKKAKESATKMADELDGINTNRGSPDYDALYDELKELEFTDTPNNPTDVAKEFFENVVHEVGELHWHKFQFPNERMIRIWDKVRTNNDIDFNAVFKKMPNNTSHEFYDKFFEVTMDGDAFLEVPINGNMVVVAEELLKDLSNGGSEFIDNFIGNSGLFDAWETLFEKPVFRANLSKLSSLSEDFVALPELENFLKTNLQKIDHWIDFDDYIKSRDASYWAEFNNPPSNLTLVRERAIKAFTKYPDEYTNAFESLGRPKSDLFTRHGVDYGDEFYDIINDFNSNNTFGLSESEIYSIFGYTTNFFYKDLNYWLREGINPNLTQDMKNLITSGLTKLPSWSDDIAFRGIKIKPPNVQQQIDDILARYPEGTNVLHGEFVSVGSSPEASFLYNPEVKFRVEFNLKPNTKAKDVSSLADGVMYQGNPISELLFPPGLDIHVDVVSLPDPEGVITMFFTEL